MHTNLYVAARQLSLPATTTTQFLHPAQLSARIRNSIIRMLDSGTIIGGGAAAQLANALLGANGHQFRHSSKSYVFLPVDIPTETRQQLLSLRQQSWAEFVMGLNRPPSQWQERSYASDCMRLETDNKTNGVGLHIEVPRLAVEMRKLIQKTTAHPNRPLADSLIARLRLGDPIQLMLWHNP